MPRVDGTYSAPYPDVIPDTTIESEVHNGTVADLVLDANTARPITAGGTGATSPAAARDNLDVMVAGAQVTNYDSHVWENGSFWSAAGATGARSVDSPFTGVAALVNNDQNKVSLFATDQTTGLNYSRVKNTTWGPWVETDLSDKVSKAGDTMTGNLTSPGLRINNGTTHYQVGGVTRWAMEGDDASFRLYNYNSAGTLLSTAITVNNLFGTTTFNNDRLSVNGSAGSMLVLATAGVPKWEWSGSQLRNNTGGFFTLMEFQDGTSGGGHPGAVTMHSPFKLGSGTPSTASAANLHCASIGNPVSLVTSSIHYKTDVQPLDKSDADKLLALQPITFRSKCAGDDPTQTHLGFIAEDVAAIEPRLVQWDNAAPRSVSYDRISVLAVAKLKEQEARIEALLARIEELEKRPP